MSTIDDFEYGRIKKRVSNFPQRWINKDFILKQDLRNAINKRCNEIKIKKENCRKKKDYEGAEFYDGILTELMRFGNVKEEDLQ